MPRTSALTDMLSTLLERRPFLRRVEDGRSIRELCLALLTEKDETSGQHLASAVLDRYKRSNEQERLDFFFFLNEELDLDPGAIAELAERYQKDPSPEIFGMLADATEPRRQELFRKLNQVPGATAELVAMRAELLRQLRANPGLARTDLDLVHLLRSWFNRGFLVLRQVTWESPASVLEKIIAYEAVHEIRNWEDLSRRLKPQDRRCFAFFHPAMPDDPLIFVEVALTRGIPDSIQDVLSETRPILAETAADTAVFYSISNCQAGLAGISFGNSLIKQVVRDLSAELENLTSFVTLSPIPGLVSWLEREGRLDALDDDERLRKAAASYLLDSKKDDGLPLDPVARFHLGNGALVHNIHAKADMSEKGLRQSGGAMVNYLYEVQKIPQHLERFHKDADVVASATVRALARQDSKDASAS